MDTRSTSSFSFTNTFTTQRGTIMVFRDATNWCVIMSFELLGPEQMQDSNKSDLKACKFQTLVHFGYHSNIL